jgi:hypothetical protein
VKPNPDLQVLRQEAAVDTREDLVVDLAADTAPAQWALALAVVVVRSMSPTFVSNPHIFFGHLV